MVPRAWLSSGECSVLGLYLESNVSKFYLRVVPKRLGRGRFVLLRLFKILGEENTFETNNVHVRKWMK